jgi:hypothetical protein
MKETDRIADQLKRAFHGDAWSGPAVNEILQGVNAEVARQKPVSAAHSIWELVHHITAWVDIVSQRIQGTDVKVTNDVNFPPVTDTGEPAWEQSVSRMNEAEGRLREIVLGFDDPRLQELRPPHGDSVYLLLHGAVQHSLYHAGQIMLLKKAAMSG